MIIPFHVIIPARFNSSRLPGKMLMDLAGTTVIERVYKQAVLAEPSSIVVATDDQRIYKTVENFGGRALMTSPEHICGTDRLVEVVEKLNLPSDAIVVNVQGDEPLIEPCLIQQVAEGLHTSTYPIYTLCWPINSVQELKNINVVKVVMNKLGETLYFSRCPLPYNRDNPNEYKESFRHIGLYAYRSEFLREWKKLPPSTMEQMEAIEPLRALDAGYSIGIAKAKVAPKQDINTAEDLAAARILLS